MTVTTALTALVIERIMDPGMMSDFMACIPAGCFLENSIRMTTAA